MPKVLTGVYYISRLCNCIMSLGRLDENGITIHINDSVNHIWD